MRNRLLRTCTGSHGTFRPTSPLCRTAARRRSKACGSAGPSAATRRAAVLDERVVGFSEVQADLTAGGALSRLGGWADV